MLFRLAQIFIDGAIRHTLWLSEEYRSLPGYVFGFERCKRTGKFNYVGCMFPKESNWCTIVWLSDPVPGVETV